MTSLLNKMTIVTVYLVLMDTETTNHRVISSLRKAKTPPLSVSLSKILKLRKTLI